MADYLVQHLPGWSPDWVPPWVLSAIAYTVVALIHAALLINVIAVGALGFIWLERKVAGRIQDRLGPTRVGGKFGWLQTLADGLKLITKEDLMPKGADGLLFRVAPYISFCASFCAYLALPFSDGWVALNLNVGVFFILAVMGLEVFGVILAGYASASKWSLFGAMREAAQVVSYEVPMGLCVVVPVLIAGSMDLVEIGQVQSGWFTQWLIFHDPFTFITFWVYFTCATASVNRAPFDLAEAESELVAGFHTEYSGLRWSYFFMAEYGSMFAVSGLAAILFFGGWNGPVPITSWLLGPTPEQWPGCLRLSGQLPRHAEFPAQGHAVRDLDDVGSLDAAAVANRPGDEGLLEILHAACGGHVPGRRGLDVLLSRRRRAAKHALCGCATKNQAGEPVSCGTSHCRVDVRRLPRPRTPMPARSESIDFVITYHREAGGISCDPINWQSFFFLLFALASCGFAVAVVLSSNIVRMALYLIMSLGASAGLFFLAGADFVGAMQLLIYVGGTLVLLVFGVMLTAQGPFISLKTRGGDWILACLLSGCLLALLVPAAFSVPQLAE